MTAPSFAGDRRRDESPGSISSAGLMSELTGGDPTDTRPAPSRKRSQLGAASAPGARRRHLRPRVAACPPSGYPSYCPLDLVDGTEAGNPVVATTPELGVQASSMEVVVEVDVEHRPEDKALRWNLERTAIGASHREQAGAVGPPSLQQALGGLPLRLRLERVRFGHGDHLLVNLG